MGHFTTRKPFGQPPIGPAVEPTRSQFFGRLIALDGLSVSVQAQEGQSLLKASVRVELVRPGGLAEQVQRFLVATNTARLLASPGKHGRGPQRGAIPLEDELDPAVIDVRHLSQFVVPVTHDCHNPVERLAGPHDARLASVRRCIHQTASNGQGRGKTLRIVRRRHRWPR